APASGPVVVASMPAATPTRVTRDLTMVNPLNLSNPLPQGQPAISVTFDHSSMQELVSIFAGFSGRSIILGKDAAGAGDVTAEIRNQPWALAFNAILQGQGLGASELPGGIIRVDTRANLTGTDSLEPLVQRVVQINYARATSLAPSLQGVVSSRGKVFPD